MMKTRRRIARSILVTLAMVVFNYVIFCTLIGETRSSLNLTPTVATTTNGSILVGTYNHTLSISENPTTIKKSKHDMEPLHDLFHFVVSTDASSLNWRVVRAFEYVFFHHPKARVIVHADKLQLEGTTLDRFNNLGYDLVIQRFNFTESILNSPVSDEETSLFLSRLEEFQKGQYWYSHVSDFLRFFVLWEYGGVYLDTDVYVLKPFLKSQLVSALGAESRDVINGAAMIFPKGHEMLERAIIAAVDVYNSDVRGVVSESCWICVGPGLITKLLSSDKALKNKIQILNSSAFQPIPYEHASRCFTNPTAFRNLNLVSTWAIHLNNKMTGHFDTTYKGTLCDELLHRNCIFCNETHTAPRVAPVSSAEAKRLGSSHKNKNVVVTPASRAEYKRFSKSHTVTPVSRADYKRFSKRHKNKNLVVFNALGNLETIPVVEYNIMAHFQTGWDCILFTFQQSAEIPEGALNNITKFCSLVRLPNTYWRDFFLTLTPHLIQQYEYVAILLDDAFAPLQGNAPVNVPRLLDQMKQHNLSSISPAIEGAFWSSTKPKRPQCLYDVNHIETFFQILTSDLFLCFRANLRHTTRTGACLDLCLSKLCPQSVLAVDSSMVTYHLGKEGNDYAIPENALQDAPAIKADSGKWSRGNVGNEVAWTTLCDQLHCASSEAGMKPDKLLWCLNQ